MSARMIVELSDGNIVLFGGGPVSGAPDVGITDDFVRVKGEAFKSALGSLAEVVKLCEASLDAMPKRPDKIELEFGATLSRDCELWIVAGGEQPEFKVKLSWAKGG
jgi:hypothetical protein